MEKEGSDVQKAPSRRWPVTAVTLLAVLANASPAAGQPALPQTQDARPMFSIDAIALLKFLEGRWSGKAPDGSTFYEQYDFPDPATMRSRRFADARFETSTDGSTVTWANGEVTSRWGEFTWKATRIDATSASFDPVNAPSSFTWRQLTRDRVAVTQRWRDEAGAEQIYSLVLERIG